jgi:hypothetical protein
VDLAAANQHTFRLSISFAGKMLKPASMFVIAESTAGYAIIPRAAIT